MGGLLGRLSERFIESRDLRFLMVGLDGSGKTTILRQLKLNEAIETCPVAGMNVEVFEYKNLRLTVSDLIDHAWHDTSFNALIFVVDSVDEDRIQLGRKQLEELLENECLKDAALLVYANKQDLHNAFSAEEVSQRLGLHLLDNREWYVKESSAVGGDGLYEGLEWLLQAVHRKRASKAFAVQSSSSTSSFLCGPEAGAVVEGKAPPQPSNNNCGNVARPQQPSHQEVVIGATHCNGYVYYEINGRPSEDVVYELFFDGVWTPFCSGSPTYAEGKWTSSEWRQGSYGIQIRVIVNGRQVGTSDELSALAIGSLARQEHARFLWTQKALDEIQEAPEDLKKGLGFPFVAADSLTESQRQFLEVLDFELESLLTMGWLTHKEREEKAEEASEKAKHGEKKQDDDCAEKLKQPTTLGKRSCAPALKSVLADAAKAKHVEAQSWSISGPAGAISARTQVLTLQRSQGWNGSPYTVCALAGPMQGRAISYALTGPNSRQRILQRPSCCA
jgi:GTPase SAR1 family protein